MTLAAAFVDLERELEALRELLTGLQVTVVEDKPLRGDWALVERFGNAADDARGYLEAALAAAQKGRASVEGQPDLEAVRRSLATCHEQFNCLAQHFTADLFSYERLAALHSVGRERRGEWRLWAGVVGDTLDRCQQHINRVSRALHRCWQDIGERSGVSSVSVRNTSVGQQVLVPES